MALPMVTPQRTGQPATIEVVGELISKPYIDHARHDAAVRRHGHPRWLARFVVPGGSAARYVSTRHLRGGRRCPHRRPTFAAGAIAGGPVRFEGVGRNAFTGDALLPMRSPRSVRVSALRIMRSSRNTG